MWLGVQLLQQDRALEAQRLQERRESAADRLTAGLEQALTAADHLLVSPPERSSPAAGEGAVLALADHKGIRVWPEGVLLYYPIVPAASEPASNLYLAAEKAEFQDRNYERAIEVLRTLSTAPDPVVKAGAQFRLARILRKAGRFDAALEVYGTLGKVTGAGLSGAPLDLVARRARCTLLEDLKRPEQLRHEAESLYRDLRAGRWRLDRASFLYYKGEIARWLEIEPDTDAARQALADAVIWLWQSWRAARAVEPDSSGRRCLGGPGRGVAVLWRASADRVTALVADSDYQRRRWFQPVLDNVDGTGVQTALIDSNGNVLHGSMLPEGSLETRRAASVTGLPWTLVITNSNVEADMEQFAARRQLLMAGLAALALLVITGSYLIGRTVSRELAVARLQSEFVSAVSHEFRTPLTSLRQFTEMLVEDDDLPAEKRRSFYRALERATGRLSRLVESLLDFGRMEAGARPYRLEPLDAAELAQVVVEEFRQGLTGKDFTVECRAPAPAIVKADREALTQAVWNLLDNAVKYSGDGRNALVEVENSEQVAIRVRDSGFGIPPSEQREIFGKFARGSSAKQHGVKGTGIGLAMIKHIVDAHGGKVMVDSEPGRGSTFTILLPRKG